MLLQNVKKKCDDVDSFGHSVTVGELRVSPWLAAPGMEHEQLGRRGLSASQPVAERDYSGRCLYTSVLYKTG